MPPRVTWSKARGRRLGAVLSAHLDSVDAATAGSSVLPEDVVPAVHAALMTIGAELEPLSSKERAQVFALLGNWFCRDCGRSQPEEPCQCEEC